jgi:hypothetical protein
MKKIFTLIAVLFSITSFAAPYPGPRDSKIAISNANRSMMQVRIDGTMYNLDNTFVLDNIRAGNHSITIYKSENSGFRKRTSVIYNSSMFISPAQLINIDINRFGQVAVRTSTENFGRDDRFNGNNRDNHDNRNNRYDDRNDRNYNNNYGRH